MFLVMTSRFESDAVLNMPSIHSEPSRSGAVGSSSELLGDGARVLVMEDGGEAARDAENPGAAPTRTGEDGVATKLGPATA